MTKKLKIAIIGSASIGVSAALKEGLAGHEVVKVNDLSELNSEEFDVVIDERKPIHLEIKEIPRFEELTYTKEQIQQLPQQIKHRKKRKFHN